MLEIRWRALPLLALPIYFIATAVQACSSADERPPTKAAPVETAPNAVGSIVLPAECAGDEETKSVLQQTLCCKRSGSSAYLCRGPTSPAGGTPCSVEGQTAPNALSANAVFDTCTYEFCGYQHSCVEFALAGDLRGGGLRCTKNGAALTWAWDSVPDVHHFETACLPFATRLCSDPYLRSEPPGFGSPEPWAMAGEGTVCVENAQSPAVINMRKVFLLKSTCAWAGAAPLECSISGWSKARYVDTRFVGVWREAWNGPATVQVEILADGRVFQSVCSNANITQPCPAAATSFCADGHLVEQPGIFGIDVPARYDAFLRERRLDLQPDGVLQIERFGIGPPSNVFRRVADVGASVCQH